MIGVRKMDRARERESERDREKLLSGLAYFSEFYLLLLFLLCLSLSLF
jgi:hypothetical protein